jgi:hypothetical protein
MRYTRRHMRLYALLHSETPALDPGRSYPWHELEQLAAPNFIRVGARYYQQPTGAVRPELRWQLYHEVSELQLELLKFARKKAEDCLRQGTWGKVKGWLADLSCLAEAIAHRFWPEIVSCNEHEQLRQAVDKLDLFWHCLDAPACSNGTGGGGASSADAGELWDDYPVMCARLPELLPPDSPRRALRPVAVGLGLLDREGKVTRRGHTEVEWAKRKQKRDEWVQIGGKRVEVRPESDLVGKLVRHLQGMCCEGRHVSLASLLLSPAQRGHGLPPRGSRHHLAPLEFRPDYEPLTALELDVKVHKDRFTSNWIGPPIDGFSTGGGGGSKLSVALQCTEADVDALWSRMCPDERGVSLAAIVALFSPSPEHRATARKRLIILAGGRSGPGTLLFGGPSENQIRGGALPAKSPHMADGDGDVYAPASLQATGLKRVLLIIMQRVSMRLNHLLSLPWQGFPDGEGFRTAGQATVTAVPDGGSDHDFHFSVASFEFLMMPIVIFMVVCLWGFHALFGAAAGDAAVKVTGIGVVTALFVEKVGVTGGAFVRAAIESSMVALQKSCRLVGWLASKRRRYYLVPPIDLTRYSPWWLVIVPVVVQLSCSWLAVFIGPLTVCACYFGNEEVIFSLVAVVALLLKHGCLTEGTFPFWDA